MKRVFLNDESKKGVNIDMAPLIDCVFLLLIFFVVSAVFDPNAGLLIDRPSSTTSEKVPQDALRVTFDRNGRLTCDGIDTTLEDLAAAVSHALAGDTERPVLLLTDSSLPTAETVHIIDGCRRGGARRVALAVTPEN